jgi:hypothetical protein
MGRAAGGNVGLPVANKFAATWCGQSDGERRIASTAASGPNVGSTDEDGAGDETVVLSRDAGNAARIPLRTEESTDRQAGVEERSGGVSKLTANDPADAERDRGTPIKTSADRREPTNGPSTGTDDCTVLDDDADVTDGTGSGMGKVGTDDGTDTTAGAGDVPAGTG